MPNVDADAAIHTAAGNSCDKKQAPKASMLTAVDTNQVDDEPMLVLTDADCKLSRSPELTDDSARDGDRQC